MAIYSATPWDYVPRKVDDCEQELCWLACRGGTRSTEDLMAYVLGVASRGDDKLTIGAKHLAPVSDIRD